MTPKPDLASGEDEPAAAVPLVGLQAWPGAESSYRLSGTRNDPRLVVTVSVQPGFALPGPADSPGQAALAAGEHAERYRLICSQLDEAGLTASLLTTLDPSQLMPLDGGVPALRRLAQASVLCAQAAAAATQPELIGIATAGELMDRFGLLADNLAAANADQPLNRLLAAGQPLAMRTGQLEPDTVPADLSTLAQVAARLHIAPGRLLEDNRGLRLAAEPAFALPGTVTLPADARTPYLTQPDDTVAALAPRFRTTAREIVAGNADVEGILPAGVHVEISVEAPVEPGDAGGGEATVETVTASTDTVAGDSFQSLRDRLAEQHAGITLDAVADELDQLGAVLTAGVLLSCPLAVLGSGRDSGDQGPLTAAEVQAVYGCPPAAFASANAAVLGVLEPDVQVSDGSRTTTTTAYDTLNAVLGRLAADAGMPSTTRVLSANADAPLFRPGARVLLPPPPVMLTAAPGRPLKTTMPAVALAVTLRLERTSDATTGTSTERADSVVPPADVDQDTLIDSFLAVLPTVRLATDAQNQLWAVSFGDEGIADVRIDPADSTGPRGFASRALYSEPVDFSAWIRPVTATGTLGTPVRRHYRAVSVEPWASSFLADLEGYLREPHGTRLPKAARASLLAIHHRLTDAVADGLAPVLRDQAEPGALRNARIAVASLARGALAETYQASVAAQYPVVVTAPYAGTGLGSARLVATMSSSDRPEVRLSTSRTELNPSNASCTFAVTGTDPAVATSVPIRPQQVFDAMELGSSFDDASTEPVLLRFARPLTGRYRPEMVLAELPPAELPLPLREHPEPVVVTPMSAEATFTGPGQPTLDQAAQWTATLSYTHAHAAQDVIALSWSEPGPAAAIPAGTATRAGTATPAGTALAEALAAYTAVAAELADLLGVAADPADEADEADEADPSDPADDDEATAVRDNAAAALTELAVAVAAAWSQHWAGREPASDPAEVPPAAGYRLRAVYDSNPAGRRLDRLVVSRARAEDSWPAIALDRAEGQVPLTPGPVTGGTREYVPAAPALGADRLTFRLDWPGLRAAPRPGAEISLSAERNAVLRAGVATSPAFLLTSPVQRVDVAPPRVRWPQELPLTGASLAEALQNAFDVLAGERPDGIRLGIEVSYAYALDADLDTVLPVLAIPELAPAPASASELATALTDWQHATRPATADAQWRISLAVLSAAQGEPPTLAFDRLVFPARSGQAPSS